MLRDLERPEAPVSSIKAHDQIINGIDGVGGSQVPELVTGSRDGTVKVWDVRQKDKPVVVVRSGRNDTGKQKDAWCVAFGNSSSAEDRLVAVGYDDGDIKLFDLRAGACLTEMNVGSGVCSIEFSRKDTLTAKLIAATMESVHVIDVQIATPDSSPSLLSLKAHNDTTVWTARHLPQSPEVFMTSGGDGKLNLYSQRKEAKGAGKMETADLLVSLIVSQQPVCAVDWHPERKGLVVCSAFDQTIKIALVIGL